MSVIRVKSANLLRRDAAANWSAKNPILREGEEGYETDTGKRKVGDGTTEWNNLKYDSGIVDQAYNPESENAQSGKAVSEAVSTEEKRSDNTFSNALKGSKTDTAILLDDVSSVSHEMRVKISSDTVEDLTAVKVSRLGKNLCVDVSDRTDVFLSGSPTTTHSITGGQLIKGFAVNGNATNYHITDFVNSNGAVSFKTSNVSYTIGIDVEVVEGVTYAVSANITGGTSESNPIWTAFLKDGLFQSYTTAQSFTVPNNCNQAILLIRPSAANTECSFSNVQLELGTTATEYEKYIAPTDYTPTADGTVNGVTSLYPNTTLTTDTDGVLIDCEYNKDINKCSGVDVYVPTKTSELINDSSFATQDYVDEEIANFDFIKIVTELPETGLVNRTYFVPKEGPNTNDLYDEYMWVDNKWELITTKQIEVDLTNYYTKSEVDDALARVTPTIKTVMDEVAVASTQYYLGEVTELNITLPEDAEIGQEITVSWYNGETASTLAIDGNMLDFDYTPEANTRSEISCLWDGTYWSVIGMSQEVPFEVAV